MMSPKNVDTKKSRAGSRSNDLSVMERQVAELQHVIGNVLEENEHLWMQIEQLQQLRELTEAERDVALRQSIKMFYKNPLARVAITSLKMYVCGGGHIHFTAKDENPEVQKHIDAFWENDAWNERLPELIERSLRDGEAFVRLFRGENGSMTTRFVDPDEITDVIRDPHDAEKVIQYQRQYELMQSDGRHETKTEVISNADIIHLKMFVDRKQKRGRTILEPVMNFLTMYVQWLESRATLNRVKANVILERVVKGTAAHVQSLADSWESSRRQRGRTNRKRVPPPGTIIDHTDDVDYKWLTPDVKADDAEADGRAIRLAIAAGLNMPEYLLTSDASNANFASTLVAESPFVRFIEFLQETFENALQRLMTVVINHAIEQGVLPATSQETKLTEAAALHIASLVRRRAWVQADEGLYAEFSDRILAEQADDANVDVAAVPTKTAVNFEWPPIVARNLDRDTKAYAVHAELGLASKETISQKLGYDFQEEQRKIRKEKEKSKDQMAGAGGIPPSIE